MNSSEPARFASTYFSPASAFAGKAAACHKRLMSRPERSDFETWDQGRTARRQRRAQDSRQVAPAPRQPRGATARAAFAISDAHLFGSAKVDPPEHTGTGRPDLQYRFTVSARLPIQKTLTLKTFGCYFGSSPGSQIPLKKSYRCSSGLKRAREPV